MRRFYFDLVTPNQRDRDELGILLPSLDEAYLEARRAAVEISRELLLNPCRGDLNSYRFELFDQDRRLVLELPFREILNPKEAARVRPMSGVMQSLRRNMARSRELKADLAAEFQEARRSVSQALTLLSRDGPVADAAIAAPISRARED